MIYVEPVNEISKHQKKWNEEVRPLIVKAKKNNADDKFKKIFDEVRNNDKK